jgi:alkyl hydroperoxide reductase subunit D
VLIQGESSYIRDLRMNLKAVLTSEHLTSKETALLAYSVVVNNQAGLLCEAFAKRAEQEGAEPQEIAEMAAIASLLSANNVLYRYRHFVGKEVYDKKPARMRMNIMMRPVVGKLFFELASLVVSAVNGCEMCVKSHEASVLKAGATEDQIWDAVRLAGVITSLSKIIPN